MGGGRRRLGVGGEAMLIKRGRGGADLDTTGACAAAYVFYW